MIAVLIVIVLFVKLLEQFGLIEAGLEGKGVLFSHLQKSCFAIKKKFFKRMLEAPEMRTEKCDSGLDMQKSRFLRVRKISKINFWQVVVMLSQQENVKTL